MLPRSKHGSLAYTIAMAEQYQNTFWC